MSVERQVEQVLRRLGSAEAPEGLEARLTARIASTETRGSSARPQWIAMGTAAVCIAAVLAVGAAWRFGEQARPREVRTAIAADQGDLRGGTEGSGITRAPQPQAHHNQQQSDAAGTFDAVPRRKRVGNAALSQAADSQTEQVRAWSEMDAPSMPEKPQPLTRQEVLLLRVSTSQGAPALAATSFDTQAKTRDGLMELGQGISAGLDRSKTEEDTHQEMQ